MSYKEQFKNDTNYQTFINEFKNGKNTILNAAKSGVIDGQVLVGSINKVVSDLQNNVKSYHENKLKEIEQKQEEIRANYLQDVDYTSNEAKQFEVKFNLADDSELQNYVQTLKSDNMLEINLLRVELRKRGLKDLDSRVRGYVAGLEGEYHNNEEYNALTKQIGTLRTMGNNAAIIDGEYSRIDTLQNSLSKEVLEIVRNNKKRTDNAQILKDMQTFTQALQTL